MTRQSKLLAAACAAFSLILLGNAQSFAVTLTAQGNANPNANMTCNPSGGYSGVSSGSVTCSAGTSSGQASSTATPGHVGASAGAVSTGPGATMDALAIYSDLFVFHNALNPLATTTTVALNVDLAGFLSAGGPIAAASVDIRTNLNSFEIGRLVASVNTTGPAQCSSSFAVGGCSFASLSAGALTSQTIEVGLDQAVLLTMRIDVGVIVANAGSSANSNFGGSLDFPIGTAVFVLPEGVTANAPGSFVTNNIFSPPDAAGTTPVPAALPLFATGLGALGLLGWRKKKAAASAS
jgi:hypothetical protein